MLPVHSPLANDFDQVLSAAIAVGLGDESERIARRAAGLQQPFMLFVMGERGSGKSTVINQLARHDVAPVDGSPESWLNVYRRRSGETDFAEIFWKSSPGKVDVLPVEQARSFTRHTIAFELGATYGIDRVVWHVNATGIHRDLAIVEVPDDPRVVAGSCWEADAVLWLSAAESGPQPAPVSAPASLAVLQRERSPFVPVLCAVTHMERVPRNRWIGRLRTVRGGYESTFDHVVPFSIERDEQGRIQSVTLTPLQRSITNWITSDAEKSRRKNHRRFVDAMRRHVCTRLEEEIDALLVSAADLSRFEADAGVRVATEIASIAVHADQYLGILSDAATAYGERLERSFHSFERGPFVPPIAGDVFFSRLADDLRAACREIGSSWQPAGDVASDKIEPHMRLVSLPALPEPPLAAVSQFVAATQPDASIVEAERFDEAHASLSGRTPTEAALYMPARLAAASRIKAASLAIAEWLEYASCIVTDAALRTARATFVDRFGCSVEEVPERLRVLEMHFVKLTGADVRVPARGGTAPVSPAEFLWQARRPGFAAAWNATLARDFVEQVLPDVGRRVQEELELHRDEQERAWQACRRDLPTELEALLTRRSTSTARRGTNAWALDRALGMLPPGLQQPLTRPTTGLVVDDASAETLSLFLSDHASFLLPRSAVAPGSPGRAAVRLFQDAVREEAARIWVRPAASSNPGQTVNVDRWKPIAGISAAAAITMGWSAASGAGFVAISAVGGLLALAVALLWRRESSRVRARSRREAMRLANDVHAAVSGLIEERNEHLQRFARLLTRDEAFLAEAERAILAQVTADAPTLPSFGDLVRRIRAFPVSAAAA